VSGLSGGEHFSRAFRRLVDVAPSAYRPGVGGEHPRADSTKTPRNNTIYRWLSRRRLIN
jgi:AraC-like DNA-binding protein